MAYPIDNKLVIAVASSARFDLSESDKVYREQGLNPYLHRDPLDLREGHRMRVGGVSLSSV